MSTYYRDGYITEGSYTYYLPTASGTIALTSQAGSTPSSSTTYTNTTVNGSISVSSSSMSVGTIVGIRNTTSARTSATTSSNNYSGTHTVTFSSGSWIGFYCISAYSGPSKYAPTTGTSFSIVDGYLSSDDTNTTYYGGGGGGIFIRYA